MAVYREGYAILEMFEKEKRWTWAGDGIEKVIVFAFEGVPVKKGDKCWNALIQLIKSYSINDTIKCEVEIAGDYYDEVTRTIKLVDEWAVSDGRKSIKEATELYNVVYTKFPFVGYDGFIKVIKVLK